MLAAMCGPPTACLMTATVDECLGRRFREFRHARGLSQRAAAEAMGLSFQQVQKYEQGLNRMRAATIYDAACFFKVSVAQFYEDLPQPTIQPLNEDRLSIRIPTNSRIAKLVRALENASPEVRQRVLMLSEVITGCEPDPG